jgi:hypothetical protein
MSSWRIITSLLLTTKSTLLEVALVLDRSTEYHLALLGNIVYVLFGAEPAVSAGTLLKAAYTHNIELAKEIPTFAFDICEHVLTQLLDLLESSVVRDFHREGIRHWRTATDVGDILVAT